MNPFMISGISVGRPQAMRPVPLRAVPRFGGDSPLPVPDDAAHADRFYPAKPNRGLLAVVKGAAHWLVARPLDFSMKMDKADKQRLRDLLDGPDSLIITPNHSHKFDALTMMEVSREVGFNFVAIGAQEVFETKLFGYVVPLPGWFLQRLGAFSVNRGAKDKSKSLNSARATVQEGKYPFVIFPEGYITWSNRAIDNLKQGGPRTAIEVAKTGKGVMMAPLGFYYESRQNLERRLSQHVRMLEARLANMLADHGREILTLPDLSLTDRVNRLFSLMVTEREMRYGLKVNTEQDAHQRLVAIQEHLLSKLEREYLGETKSGPVEMRARRLVTSVTLSKKQALAENGKSRWFFFKRRREMGNAGEALTWGVRLRKWKRDIASLQDVMRLSMYPPGYLENSDPDRLLETVYKLDRDINNGEEMGLSGALEFFRHLRVHVGLAEPINVNAFLAEPANRDLDDDALAERLTERIEEALSRTVELLAARVAQQRSQRQAPHEGNSH